MVYSLVAAFVVASLSISGILFFRNHPHVTGTHRFIVPVALGMFLGVVFFELIPETLHANEAYGSAAIVGGFLAFYLLSHLLRTYHHHHHDHCESCVPKSSAHLLLIGDSIHNIADGIVITTAFLINPALGIATTMGIALHEIPQEIAEFGVLIQAGYSKTRAALYNLLSASSIFVGVIVAHVAVAAGDYLWILTGIAAGNLLYIAASDMIPELHGEQHRSHFKYTFTSTIIGLLLIVGLITWSHTYEHHDEHPEELPGVELAN